MDISVPMFWRSNKERYNILANKCNECNELFIPLRKNCINCEKNNLEIQNLSGKGKVYSYTIIRSSPQGFESPYIVGMIKLDKGPIIMGEIIGIDVEDIDKLNIDLLDRSVSHVFRKLFETKEDLRVYGVKFLLEN